MIHVDRPAEWLALIIPIASLTSCLSFKPKPFWCKAYRFALAINPVRGMP